MSPADKQQGAEGWQQGYYNSDGHFVCYEYGGEGGGYHSDDGQQGEHAASEPEHTLEDDDGSEDAVEEAVRLSYLSWINEQGMQPRWAALQPAANVFGLNLGPLNAGMHWCRLHGVHGDCCRPDTFSAAVSGAAALHSGEQSSGQTQQGLCPAQMHAGYCSRGSACPLVHGHFCQVQLPHPPHK